MYFNDPQRDEYRLSAPPFRKYQRYLMYNMNMNCFVYTCVCICCMGALDKIVTEIVRRTEATILDAAIAGPPASTIAGFSAVKTYMQLTWKTRK